MSAFRQELEDVLRRPGWQWYSRAQAADVLFRCCLVGPFNRNDEELHALVYDLAAACRSGAATVATTRHALRLIVSAEGACQ